jgi:putative DNA-invertase from lambdoid prophage Rac
MKSVLYCRVSTVDQTLDHQRTQALQVGFTPDLVLADHGVSGVSTRLCERPEGRRLFDILREGDTLVVRWVDRLGRNYQDVTDTVREFIRLGIRIETVINRMTFDGTTTDPMQQAIRDSLLAFMAAMAQSQAEVIKEAQKAGIAHALANDDGTKYRGRKPTFTCEQFARGSRKTSDFAHNCFQPVVGRKQPEPNRPDAFPSDSEARRRDRIRGASPKSKICDV